MAIHAHFRTKLNKEAYMAKSRSSGVEKDHEAEQMKIDASIEFSRQAIEDLFETSGVDKVFGKPIKHGEVIVIPAAEVITGAGFGAGSGFGPRDSESTKGSGSGSGGGGRSFSRPVAVILATPEGVRVEPVIDPTKILLGALTASGFILAMMSRMMNPRKAMKAIREG
jgi:uncharacterized spore protein YtfJ